MGGDDDLRICKPGGTPGTVFPANPLGDQDSKFKVIFYGAGLLYSFIGVSIVADMFMSAIERVTSRKRRVKVPGTANRFITTNVWNETVANLTLMALGSSAPEILLAINDILKNRFHAGDLGPSTIVGSAAFNLFVIIAVCINAVPSGETRQIKETGVFFITAIFSLFAYIWLLIIVQLHTPDIVDVSEGVLTFVFFPVLVAISYASDAGLIDDWIKKQEEQHEHHEDQQHHNGVGAVGKYGNFSMADKDPQEDEPEEEPSVVYMICAYFCTILLITCKVSVAVCAIGCDKLCRMCASACRLCGRCLKCCCRRHRKKTEDDQDGSAEFGEDQERGEPQEIDWEDPSSMILDDEGNAIENETGIMTFASDSMEVLGDLEEKQYTVPVYRKNGLHGRISCTYRMEKFTATPGYDYVEESGVVDFKNGVSKADITITILPKEIGEKSDTFQLVLEEPTNESFFNPNSDGGEDCCLLTITILNANPGASTFQARLFGILDSWINMDEMRQGSAAWYDQIQQARYVNGSPEDQEEAKAMDWMMHIIVFPWKMLYALLTPPPIYLGGWVCFNISLMHIGCLTALIGDMAELFGCAAGIPDNITAISVVALGTSLPDLFASKMAAMQDEWADASIVNVTGSNSVNVFLGIGVPWMMAAIYWSFVDGTKDSKWVEDYYDDFIGRCPSGCFVVPSGDLAFSVIVFTLGACVCLVLIRVRRVVYDGELGGPANSDSKACSSCLMISLWFFYIGLVCWKSFSGADSWAVQIIAIAICVPIIIVLMIFFGIMLQLLNYSRDYIGEEGFFGISVAVAILFLRVVYFIVFQ